MHALVIDGFGFCRAGERREGEVAVAELARLAAETTDSAGSVKWAVQGGSDKLRHPKLTMKVSGAVHLMCQRCLTPYEFAIDSESTLILAESESSIDELEATLDDETVDVIAGDKPLDLAVLIEDETLLALPVSPRHETCPDTKALEALKQVEKPSPFAVLKNIKPSR